MRKLTNKLFISILTVAFAVIALGTTTFAWFTLSNTATITPFQAQVTAGEGIEVSIDNVNWYTTLSDTVVETYLFDASRYTSTFKLDLVTSEDGMAFETLLGAAVLPSAHSKYIQFTLYFRAFAATSIYWDGATITSTGRTWVPDASFNDSVGGVSTALVAGGTGVPRKAADATRISVKGTAATPVIYELATAGTNTALGAETAVESTDPGQAAYNFAKGIDLTRAIVTPATITDTLLLNESALVDLAETSGVWNGSVVVTIWLEGWDPNAFNAILSDTLSVGLVFKNTNA